MISLDLFDSLRSSLVQPIDSVLNELLNDRFQRTSFPDEVQVVDRPESQDTCPRESSPNSIHQRSAGFAEVVGHDVVRSEGSRLGISSEVGSTSCVDEVGVEDDEVCSEHRRGEFSTVVAVADEGFDEAWGLERLEEGRREMKRRGRGESAS